MVLQIGVDLGLALAVRAQQPPALIAQVALHEPLAPARGVQQRLGQGGVLALDRFARERRRGVGQRGDHERVPGGQALVVEARAHAGRAGLEQALADATARLPVGPRARIRRPRLAQHVQAGLGMVRIGEVAALAGAQPGDRGVGVGAELLPQFGHGPHVEASLDALRVGVQGGVEAALRAAHLAQRPAQRVHAHVQQVRLRGRLPAVQVRAREQGVVVQHLLEVRHRPGRIDAVAREAPADVVVDAPASHRAQRAERHRALRAQQQELDHRRVRELGRAPEAAVARVEGRAQRAHRRVQLARVDRLG